MEYFTLQKLYSARDKKWYCNINIVYAYFWSNFLLLRPVLAVCTRCSVSQSANFAKILSERYYIVSCFTNACPFSNAIPRKFNFFSFFFLVWPCARSTTTLWFVNHSKESSEIFNNAKNFAWDVSTTRKFLISIFAQRTTDFDNEFSPWWQIIEASNDLY